MPTGATARRRRGAPRMPLGAPRAATTAGRTPALRDGLDAARVRNRKYWPGERQPPALSRSCKRNTRRTPELAGRTLAG